MKVLQALSQDVCKTPEMLADETGIKRREVVKVAGSLISHGLADRREVGCYVRNPAGEAFLLSGQILTCGPKGPLTQPQPRRWGKITAQSRAWQAMCLQGKFSLADIVMLAARPGDDPDKVKRNVARFVTRLTHAGYLTALRREPGTALTSNGFKRWVLLRNSGPAAPVYVGAKHAMHDPNSNEFHPLERPAR